MSSSNSPLSISAADLLARLENSLFPVDGLSADSRESRRTLEALPQLAKADTSAFIDGALMLCQRLYIAGRSIDAVPVARICHNLASIHADAALKQRAARVYGNILTDTGDISRAMEIYAAALKLAEAEQDSSAIAHVWNNLAVMFTSMAAYDVAVESYWRALNQLQQGPIDISSFYTVYLNLALCHLHMGDLEAGLDAAENACALETPEIVCRNPAHSIFLRRNYVRLLIMAKRPNEAAPLVDEAIHLSETHPSERTTIAALVTQAIYDVACGEVKSGLDRLEHALARARRLPAALRDTLMCMMQAQEAAGRPDRAAFYLSELADHVHRRAVSLARQYIELSKHFSDEHSPGLEMIERARHELGAKSKAFPLGPEWDVFERITVAAQFKVDGDGLHGLHSGELARLLALEAGYDESMAEDIGFAACFHDIGMATIPDMILSKPQPLNANERKVMQNHCRAGADMLAASTHPRALLAVDMARYHHEWWNGEGYPQGIAGETIPRTARLCAVVDVFDAMVSQRSYHTPLSVDAAAAQLQTLAARQLDPQLVGLFVASLKGEHGAIRQYLSAAQPTLGPMNAFNALLARLKRGPSGKSDK